MKRAEKRALSSILALVMMLQIVFVSGITASASNEMPIVPAEPQVSISGLNLLLDGEIGLVYHVYVPDDYPDGYVTLSCKDDTVRIDIKDCTAFDKNLRYMFTYHLSAIALSEEVTITVYDKNGTSLATASESAEGYAKRLLDDPKATDAEKKVAETLINYGHYAQLACAEANGWVIGETFAETAAFYAPSVDPSVFSGYDIEWSTHSGSFTELSVSLRLDYKTSLVLYVPVDEKPTVKVNGKEIEATPGERVANTYRIEIPGINALSLADQYTVEINDVTVTLCAFSYCRLAAEYNNSQNVIDTIRALYEFFIATDSYLHPNTESEAVK